MRKKHLWQILTIIVLSGVVAVSGFWGSTVPLRTSLAMASETSTPRLFDVDGNYTVGRAALIKGAVFNFFGFDWQVVKTTENVATFWMVKPYTTYTFNVKEYFGRPQAAENTWSNGYTNTLWQETDGGTYTDVGESGLRYFLRTEAANILDAEGYAAYRDKVVAGPVAGLNFVYGTEPQGIETIYYRDTAVNRYAEGRGTMLVNSDLTAGDVWWLPAYEEVCNNGLWGLTNTERNWVDIRNGNVAWLRSPNVFSSYKAVLVGSSSVIYDPVAKGNVTDAESIFTLPLDRECGIRPAIHLSLASLDHSSGEQPQDPDNPTPGPGGDEPVVNPDDPTENPGNPSDQPSGGTTEDPNNDSTNQPSDDPNNGSPEEPGGNTENNNLGWLTAERMKIIFLVVCALGVVGIICVSFIAIRKIHQEEE